MLKNISGPVDDRVVDSSSDQSRVNNAGSDHAPSLEVHTRSLRNTEDLREARAART
jgi:hypothetical protein